jgi:hypothetical protein
MNLYHATAKGLRECRETPRQRLQHPMPRPSTPKTAEIIIDRAAFALALPT